MGTGAGIYGLAWNYIVSRNGTQGELYIDRRDDRENEVIFNQFLASKDSIEADFGESLNWNRLEGKRACRIAKRIEVDGWRDEEKWQHVISSSINAMGRVEKALKPFVIKIKVKVGRE